MTLADLGPAHIPPSGANINPAKLLRLWWSKKGIWLLLSHVSQQRGAVGFTAGVALVRTQYMLLMKYNNLFKS